MLQPRFSSIVSCSRTIPEEDDMKTETRQPRINTLRVDDVMHRGVFTCEREARLSEVAATMAREHVHCVVVESDNGEERSLWGIVSDLDLVAAASVRDLDDQSAGASAAAPVVTVSPDETLERAAQLMTEHNTAHLIVVDRERPIGVLSTIDIAAGLAGRPAGARWRPRELR
jgi:CBS domain-containing protein